MAISNPKFSLQIRILLIVMLILILNYNESLATSNLVIAEEDGPAASERSEGGSSSSKRIGSRSAYCVKYRPSYSSHTSYMSHFPEDT